MAIPLALSLAQARIDNLLDSAFVAYSGERIHKMRVERVENIKKILRVMLNAACLQHDGVFLSVFNGQGRALTVGDISARTNIPERNVKRCLHDLRVCGLLNSEEQFRRQTHFGEFLVSPVLRSFSKLFWKSLRLWELFVKSVKRAQQGKKILLKRIIYKKDAGKPDTQQKNNNAFMQALECKAARGPNCSGGYSSKYVCELCKKL